MSVRVMIVDGQAEFRSLLTHHVTAHWSDAVITAYDPVTAGHLPDTFSGAGNDLLLLGDDQGEREGLDTLRRYLKNPNFPPVVYFGSGERDDEAAAARLGAAAYFRRDGFSHAALTVMLGDALRARQRVASTGSLFVGDLRTGINPLIKGYRLVQKLAATEHSALYLAERESTGLRVVLKVLQQVPDVTDTVGAFERFLQEYELIAGLDHPNIVHIYDLGVSDTHAHIAMEYLAGGDLKGRIHAGVREADAISFVQQIGGALSRIHSVGILHRDLKPGNIMFRDDNTIALIDFGLAKRMRLSQEITGSGEIFGTPYYMSPEQGRGDDVDPRSDIYSLGVIFFEMLTGSKPFRAGNAMGIIYQHCQAPIPLLPPRLAQHQALVNLMLAKNPEDRLQRADEIGEWL